MFRQLKNGKFAPHAQISTHSVMTEEIKQLVKDLSINVSNQLYDTGIATIKHAGTTFTDAQLAAITELIVHELIYYHQLCEIGCFLASAFVDEENTVACTPRAPPSDDDSESEEEEEDCAPLCRSMSSATPRAASPAPKPVVDSLSSNLLVASGNIRKLIIDLFQKMAMPNEQFMLGPAGYANAHNETQQRYYHGLLVHAMFVRFGGGTFKRVEITSGMSPDQVLADIVEIAKSAWTLMNLCGMLNVFKFAATNTPLFNTIQIDPTESVFGNYGWKPVLQAATVDLPLFRHWTDDVPQSDDVPSSVPQSDDVPSYD
jgi:hypothetical protein